MSWLSKIFRYPSPRKQKRISFGKGPCWEVSSLKSFPSFLRALSDLVPSDSVLYIEAVNPPKDILLYMEARKPTQPAPITTGTIFPRPRYLHMLINADNLEGFAKMNEKHDNPVGAFHLHVYKDNKILLEWFDAFLDPFYISKEISEDKIKIFCERLGIKYKEFVYS
jgi:hypothetical protein